MGKVQQVGLRIYFMLLYTQIEKSLFLDNNWGGSHNGDNDYIDNHDN